MALLEVSGLVTEFATQGFFRVRKEKAIRAVDGVSFNLEKGDILGVVGESGSGKSTMAKTVLGLYRERSGTIVLDGRVVSHVDRLTARKLRGNIQYIHQDPGAALDPWWTIGSTLHESLKIYGFSAKANRQTKIDAILKDVGLNPSFSSRYPHELSGGQQRRIGLARTLVLKPEIVILDEPTAGLDLSVQAAVVKLFMESHRKHNLSYIFISHDLSVVRRLCTKIIIMRRGQIVEQGPTGKILSSPEHEYTRQLLDAILPLQRGKNREVIYPKTRGADVLKSSGVVVSG
jgi:ABC-type oligopeptide transport system ATPase subunit